MISCFLIIFYKTIRFNSRLESSWARTPKVLLYPRLRAPIPQWSLMPWDRTRPERSWKLGWTKGMTVPKNSNVMGDSVWVRVPWDDKQDSRKSLFCYFCSLSLSGENPCLQLWECGRNWACLLCHSLWHRRRLPESTFGNVSHEFPLLGSGQRTSWFGKERAQERVNKGRRV